MKLLLCHYVFIYAGVRPPGRGVFTLYSWMMPLCISLGGGSQETLTLELLPSFAVATVTARGGALGTVRGSQGGQLIQSFHRHTHDDTRHTEWKGARSLQPIKKVKEHESELRQEGKWSFIQCFKKLIVFFCQNKLLRQVDPKSGGADGKKKKGQVLCF